MVLERPILLSIDFTGFVYRNPAWPHQPTIDQWADSDEWKRRVGYVYHETGRNIRAMSNIVLEVDGKAHVQPETFFPELEERNVLVPAETTVYGSNYARYAFSAVNKLYDKFGEKVDVVHFGTLHGLNKNNPDHWENDPCSASWHRHLLEKERVNQITLVFPDWQRKFGTVGGLMPGDSDVRRLPDAHAPIRGVWFSEWRGFAEPRVMSAVFASRTGAITPPWLDDGFTDFISQIQTETFRGLGDHIPSESRPWDDSPPPPSLLESMRASPKKAILPEPRGILVNYNGRPLAVA